MSDEVFVSTKLVGNIRIDLGNKRIVTPDSALKISKAVLMAIPGVDKMLKNGKLVILENLAPVEEPKAPEAPPAPPVPVEEPKAEKKAKKARAEPVAEPVVEAEPESQPESEEPKE